MGTIYCENCWNAIPLGASFCPECGTKVTPIEKNYTHATNSQASQAVYRTKAIPVNSLAQKETQTSEYTEEDFAETNEVSKDMVDDEFNESDYRYRMRMATISFVFGILSAIGLGILMATCSELFKNSTKTGFNIFCVGIVVLALISIRFFFSAWINSCAIMGIVFSVLTIAVLALFLFVFIPNSKKQIHEDYLKMVKLSAKANSEPNYAVIECYPYSTIRDFYSYEPITYYYEVEDYLLDLFVDEEYAKWISASMFVNESLNREVYEMDFIRGLWDSSEKLDAYNLKNYKALFNLRAFSATKKIIEEFEDDLNTRIESVEGRYQAGQIGSIKVVGVPSYSGEFRVYKNEVLLYRLRSGIGEASIIVIDVETGKYFYY